MQIALGKPDYRIPYWQWSLDSQDPSSSPIFKPDTFGTNGDPTTGCVKDGRYKDFTQDVGVPASQCITRATSFLNKTFCAPEIVFNAVKTCSSYSQLERAIVCQSFNIRKSFPTITSTVSLEARSNLTVFHRPLRPRQCHRTHYSCLHLSNISLHHAMVDRLWAEWQKNPAKLFEYNGLNQDQVPASLNDILYPYAFIVKDFMNVADLCYEYSAGVAPSVSVLSKDRKCGPGVDTIKGPSNIDQYVMVQMGADPDEAAKQLKQINVVLDSVNSMISNGSYVSPCSLNTLACSNGNWKSVANFEAVTEGYGGVTVGY